jgi:hypothetical protein
LNRLIDPLSLTTLRGQRALMKPSSTSTKRDARSRRAQRETCVFDIAQQLS